MNMDPLPLTSAFGAFLLAFPALFSIVNPLGSALIFDQVTSDRSLAERHALATRIAFNSTGVLLGSLWLGGYILTFFGVSLGALRIAWGLVVAVRARGLLAQPEEQENRNVDAAAGARACRDDVSFFPLTMPLTTGPGSIAVAIALSSQRPASGLGTLSFFGGMSVAVLAIASLIWLT